MLERSDHAEEGFPQRVLGFPNVPQPLNEGSGPPLSTPMFHPFDIPQMAGHTSASSLLAKRSLTTNSR